MWGYAAKSHVSTGKRKGDTRGSLTQKKRLGAPLLGLGWVSEGGANCGEYKALAAPGSYQMPVRVCMCLCAGSCIPSLFCLLSLPASSRDPCGSGSAILLPTRPDLTIFLRQNNRVWLKGQWPMAVGRWPVPGGWLSSDPGNLNWSRRTASLRSHLACR